VLARAVVVAFVACCALGCPRQELLLCGTIPEGGCPIGRGGSCEDVLCAALYDCVEGSWTSVQTCPEVAGSGGGGGSGGAGAGGGQGGEPCTVVEIDHSAEVAGCEPDLQHPDCPAVAAETCAETACLTDCLDFYLCMRDGWQTVAYCDERGQLVRR
jgi:hypothetical protein